MENLNYDGLQKIVEKNIAETLQTKNFNFGKFLQEMEQGFIAHGFRESDKLNSGVENILILRLDAVGDFILLSPAIRELRRNYPFANITLVVNKRVYPMAERCPYVNEVLAFETPNNSTLNDNDLMEIISRTCNFSRKYLWKRHYSLCYIFCQDFTHFFMGYFSGAEERVGYVYDNPNYIGKFLLTKSYLISNEPYHHVGMNLNLLKLHGLRITNTNLELWYDAEDKLRAKKLLKGFAPDKIKIIIGIGASIPERKYPVEKYLKAFKKIVKKGAALIIVGGSSEAEDARFLQENLPADSVLNLVDVPTGWRVDSAVTALADMYIGNDTGTLHIAEANHLPVIYLSRESKERENKFKYFCEHMRFFPYQVPSIVLLSEKSLGDCGKNMYGSCSVGKAHCIAQIRPDEIVAAYDTMAKIIKSDIKEIKCPPIIRSINQEKFFKC